MAGELRELGLANGAPVLLSHAIVSEREWVGLTYKPQLGDMCTCFWSTRDDVRVSTEALVEEIRAAVEDAIADETGRTLERLWDIAYKQPDGWDRWGRPGVPNPIRWYWDEELYPKLRVLMNG